MNQMTQALQAAGVQTPSQMQRIWTALKDSHRTPGMTSKDVAAATGIKFSNVSSILTDMFKRNMVSVVKAPRRAAAGAQHAFYYTALGNKYELKPRRHTKPTARPATSGTAFPLPANYMPPAAPAPKPPAPSHGVDLDKLTLGQIKALLADIQALFNNK